MVPAAHRHVGGVFILLSSRVYPAVLALKAPVSRHGALPGQFSGWREQNVNARVTALQTATIARKEGPLGARRKKLRKSPPHAEAVGGLLAASAASAHAPRRSKQRDRMAQSADNFPGLPTPNFATGANGWTIKDSLQALTLLDKSIAESAQTQPALQRTTAQAQAQSNNWHSQTTGLQAQNRDFRRATKRMDETRDSRPVRRRQPCHSIICANCRKRHAGRSDDDITTIQTSFKHSSSAAAHGDARMVIRSHAQPLAPALCPTMYAQLTDRLNHRIQLRCAMFAEPPVMTRCTPPRVQLRCIQAQPGTGEENFDDAIRLNPSIVNYSGLAQVLNGMGDTAGAQAQNIKPADSTKSMYCTTTPSLKFSVKNRGAHDDEPNESNSCAPESSGPICQCRLSRGGRFALTRYRDPAQLIGVPICAVRAAQSNHRPAS